MDVYLEIGAKRVFAGAVDWPGWSRSGRDEQAALRALGDYAPRYAAAVEGAGTGFEVPDEVSFGVVERLAGNATTDFGAPGRIPVADERALDARGLKRLERILRAVWQAFDEGVEAAGGAPLRGGPRGGGRDLEKIVAHVRDGELAYLRSLGGSYGPGEGGAELAGVHDAFVDALGARARGEVADRGPRGGARWPARYAARRAAWHVLDHLWEVEDRSAAG